MWWVVGRLLLGMLYGWVGMNGCLAVWRVLLRRSLCMSLVLCLWLLLSDCVLILGRR